MADIWPNVDAVIAFHIPFGVVACVPGAASEQAKMMADQSTSSNGDADRQRGSALQLAAALLAASGWLESVICRTDFLFQIPTLG